VIEIENLYKSFDGHRVLNGLSLNIEKGQVLALIGASGCGKSVLLKHMAGLMAPDRGRVLIDGQDIWAARGKALRALRERLGFLFQGGALFDSMSVFENVAFPLKEKTRLSDQTIRSRVFGELERVGLSGSEHKYPSQISGGMVKRAALARALIREPEIMFFDEPTTGLDPVIGRAILNLIDACHRKLSFTGIIVTHEIPQVFTIVDRVAMLHEGSIRAEGSPHDLAGSADKVVQSFVGDVAREVRK
jgi:phospholipid/cholesterol/gamma-HCH transport system ATP-binding protein